MKAILISCKKLDNLHNLWYNILVVKEGGANNMNGILLKLFLYYLIALAVGYALGTILSRYLVNVIFFN